MLQHLKFLLHIRRILFAISTLLVLGGLATQALSQADHRVGLVVRHGDGAVTTRCVELDKPRATGYEVLEASGLELSVEFQSIGAAICSIEGQGCSFPQKSCFCQCMSSPCVYWTYWQLREDEWVYSELGAGNSEVAAGSVEGWSWSSGIIGQNADLQPPVYSFAEICEPERVATETAAAATTSAAATASAAPTVPPARTNTPVPAAASSTPAEPPLITYLAPDRTRILVGESVVLTWETTGATSVLLDTNGQEQGLATSGNLTLTPAETTTYWVLARSSAGEDRVSVTIVVDPATPTSTPAPTDTAPEATLPEATPPTAREETATTTLSITATATSAAPVVVSTPVVVGTPIVMGTDSATASATASATPVIVATATPVMIHTPTPLPATATPAPELPTPTATATPLTVASVRSRLNRGGQEAQLTLEASPQAEAGQLRRAFGGLIVVLSAPLVVGALVMIYLRRPKRDQP